MNPRPGVAAALVAIASLSACESDGAPRGAGPQPTPTANATTGVDTSSCADGSAEPTPAQTEGPYFKAGAPEKTDFHADVNGGTPLELSGTVVSTACDPISRARIELWQADHEGNYDNEGYRLRGHFFTDDNGAFAIETVVPGAYPGRTPHIHIKVQPPGGDVLTTQLYMPGDPQNERDSIFSPELTMSVRDGGDGKVATFTFVVETD